MKLLSYSGPVILLVLGFGALFGLSSLKKEPPQKAPQTQTALVEVARVRSCESGFTISVDGEVVPHREISLAAQVAGRIAKKNPSAQAGYYVRKGDLLFEIDPRDYELEVRRLQETAQQAGSSIEELDVEQSNDEELVALASESLALQRKEVGRFENLKRQGATSTSQLEKVRQAEIESLNSLQALKNRVTLNKARRNRLAQEKQMALTNLEQAELNLSRATITSPLDGVVIQDFAEQDDFVQPGTRVIQLEDTSKIEVRFSLRMEQLQWLWKSASDSQETLDRSATLATSISTPAVSASNSVGTQYTYDLPKVPIDVSVELNGNRFIWQAFLDRYDGAGINGGTRTVPVIAVVEDPTSIRVQGPSEGKTSPPTLLRGSFVSVEVPVGDGMNLVSIPASAYQPDKTVWLYDNGKLRIQPVNVAYSDESTVVVQAVPDRLQPGASVITSPLPIAEEGMDIRLPKVATSNTEPTKTATDSEVAESR